MRGCIVVFHPGDVQFTIMTIINNIPDPCYRFATDAPNENLLLRLICNILHNTCSVRYCKLYSRYNNIVARYFALRDWAGVCERARKDKNNA